MFMALGAGVGEVAQLAVVAAMFHLFTHAFFKALLFLASGSVMHAMGDVIDMRRFGGLRHRLPYTYWTFLAGGLALAGVFPLAGFWSKDEILLALKSASHAAERNGWVYSMIYWLAILTAFMTAFYVFRAFFMTFFGSEKLPSPDDPEAPPADASASHAHHAAEAHGDDFHGAHGHDHDHVGHESPPIMTYPLIVLAACSVLAGLIFGPTHLFEGHLHKTLGFELLRQGEHGFEWATALISTIAALAGLALAYAMYYEPSTLSSRLAERFKPLYLASLNKFYVDEIYDWLAVKTTRAAAIVFDLLDVYLLHNLVLGIGRLPRKLGRDLLAGYQNGLIQFYAAASALGVAGLLFLLLLFSYGSYVTN
jgi:NADH-quinone oxidoreductase subunit L